MKRRRMGSPIRRHTYLTYPIYLTYPTHLTYLTYATIATYPTSFVRSRTGCRAETRVGRASR